MYFGVYKYCSFLLMSKTTENELDERGATSLSDALKTNTTLTKLKMTCEQKKQDTNGIHQQSAFYSLLSNQQGTGLETQEQYH